MRKVFKRIKKALNKYVNGAKGMISIFLAICMLPFFSIALLLTESARYQSVITLVDELLDCIGMSTIADYDNYLDDRFGLFAIDQAASVDTTYDKYLKENIKSISDGYTYKSGSVEGKYPLSNKEVLKHQLMEYSEVTVLAETVYNGLDVNNLIKNLEKRFKLDKVSKYADAAGNVADAAKAGTEIINAVKDCLKALDKYISQKPIYKNAAADFYQKSEELINELNSAAGELDEDEDTDLIYSESDVNDAVIALEEARDTFQTETGNMATCISDLKTAIAKIYTNLESLDSNIVKAQNSINKLENDSTTRSSEEWLKRVAQGIALTMKKYVAQDTFEADMQLEVTRLTDEQQQIRNVVCDINASDGTDSTKYYINKESERSQIENDFPIININTVKDTFYDELNGKLTSLDNTEANLDSGQSANLMQLLDIAGNLINVTGLYNGALDSQVAPSNFYSYSSGELAPSTHTLIVSITSIVQSGRDFVDSLKSLNILKALKATAEFLLGVAAFLASVVLWVGEVIVNLAVFLTSGSEMYNTFLLCGYCAYNLPNRTNYSSGKTLTATGTPVRGGTKYISVYSMMNEGSVASDYFSGTFDDIDTLTKSIGSGDDRGFKGAEAEYIFTGTNNELLNQSSVFFSIYLFRMVLNLFTIFKDTQVEAMAAAATVASWVVYLAIILAEPLIDTILIVNGQKEYVFKDFVYLTPGGIMMLLQKLPSLTNLPQSTKDCINDSFIAHNGDASVLHKPKKIGLEMDYTEHLLVLMWLKLDQSTMLTRIQNLIQMECAQKYRGKYDFSLDHTYTCIRVTATGSLKSMFDIKELTNGGPFTFDRTRVISY